MDALISYEIFENLSTRDLSLTIQYQGLEEGFYANEGGDGTDQEENLVVRSISKKALIWFPARLDRSTPLPIVTVLN